MRKHLHNILMSIGLHAIALAIRITKSGVKISRCEIQIEGSDKQRKQFYDMTCDKFPVIELRPDQIVDVEVYH